MKKADKTPDINTAGDMLNAWNSGRELKLARIAEPLNHELPLQVAMFEALEAFHRHHPSIEQWHPARPDIIELTAPVVGKLLLTCVSASSKEARRAMYAAYLYYCHGYSKAQCLLVSSVSYSPPCVIVNKPNEEQV